MSWNGPPSELLYLTLNNVAKPTNETAVRQAIKLAIDRKTIVQKVLLDLQRWPITHIARHLGKLSGRSHDL